MSVLTEMPERFAAGTTVELLLTSTDYPANDGWTLSLSLAGAGVLTVAGASSGADHAITLTAAQTADLPAGSYRWALDASKAGTVKRFASGRLAVEPNLAAAGAGDLQSTNEKILAAIEAVIASRLGTATGSLPKDIESYAIDGIAVTKIPMEQLERMRTRYAFAVAREKRGGGIGRQHRIAFTGAQNE